ncbi:hypothetical protein QRD89_18025 [Halobacillus sp. ACCC02827]|uniref:hypothetical protein n=1 Tax=Bacillaceae TaxID=186817 RepID=UPI0002A4DC48|nr:MULTISPECIES: hypothetical protein [Bacillaceae]ELK46336.1 hypothetical protein D479_10951 [Halobacillus sp. BAB-2008]QHT48361.1 hypothetical protein M662_18340 [Bacillus sp. SB49]WJE15595.1 hypothetical protein QRD89_18025 [Halobacillus sp. ACCC02827]
MAQYFANQNQQADGGHEVHVEGCNFMPFEKNLLALGGHSECSSALEEARNTFDKVNGCQHCCPDCHM